MASIECAGFIFSSNFDSGNLAKVEWVPRNESAIVSVSKNGKDVPEIPDMEFNIWTKPDCVGTEFENGNRTWFHFGVKGYLPSVLLKLNLVDLNRQAKMYSQGMAPVYRMVPGSSNWQRIRDKPTYTVEQNIFTLSFKFKTPENTETIMFFAFTYPYTYTELQSSLMSIDQRFLSRPHITTSDDIYFVRELLCKSLEDRRIDLLTISSYHNITNEKETRLMHLFPEEHVNRPFKFKQKKVIFVSARVHPGETPSSFVFNGLLQFLLNREDPVAIILRRMYVFKMIPFLNPDGVVNGHYRTDTRGVNLNRMYLSPTLAEHPSIFAARALIQYYHTGVDQAAVVEKFSNDTSFTSANNKMTQQVEVLSLEENQDISKHNSEPWGTKRKENCEKCDKTLSAEEFLVLKLRNAAQTLCSLCLEKTVESGIFMYLDMHGHASKKGIFIYGNHFEDTERNIECMLLPKIMSLNNYNFHFTACNFTERNMYLRDRRDGMSREGSGRVAVLKLTGLVRSYTLECNYNSGRMVNVLPPSIKEGTSKTMHTLPLPPKYTPQIFEEVGRALCLSILDLTNSNPNSRIPNSEFHNLNGLRDWLRINCSQNLAFSRIALHNKVQAAQNQNSSKPMRCKSMKALGSKARSNTSKLNTKKTGSKNPIPVERKENMAMGSRDQNAATQSSSSYSASSSCSKILIRSASKSKGLSVRSRTKRDNTQRTKTKTNQVQSSPKISTRSIQTSSTTLGEVLKTEKTSAKESTKRIKVTPENVTDRLKLREICFIRENLTKKIIAKFSSTDSNNQETHDDDDDLVVAWDPTFSPKIISKQEIKSASAAASRRAIRARKGSGTIRQGSTIRMEPSTSKDSSRQNFKNNAFNAKVKRSKGSLRRLNAVNLEVTGKIDEMKKRKKLKSKIL